MTIFHCYVSSPEGNGFIDLTNWLPSRPEMTCSPQVQTIYFSVDSWGFYDDSWGIIIVIGILSDDKNRDLDTYDTSTV